MICAYLFGKWWFEYAFKLLWFNNIGPYYNVLWHIHVGDHSEKKSDKISRYATVTQSSRQQNIHMLPKFINSQCYMYLDVCCLNIYSIHLLVIITDKTVTDDLGTSTVALNSHLPLQILTSLAILVHWNVGEIQSSWELQTYQMQDS